MLKSYNDWYDFALNRLGFTETEAAEFARIRVAEDLNRERLRTPDYKDAA